MTFLFTDVEGSTRLFHLLADRYRAAQADHHRIIRAALAAHGGVEVKTQGDGFFAVFTDPADAVAMCAAAQAALEAHEWPGGHPLRVRMGLHTGEAHVDGGDYVALAVHQAARVSAAAHGGQVLLSADTAGDVAGRLAPGLDLLDVGRFRLKGFEQPQTLFQLVVGGDTGRFPAPHAAPAIAHNIAPPATRLIGRRHELATVLDLLEHTRLVTIAGPGGAGKTRLAQEVAMATAPAEPDGAWMVALAPLTRPELVWDALAVQFGVAVEPGRPLAESVVDALSHRQLLVVLDNCEHLVEACARVAADLLRSCHGVRIVATSRDPLNIAGETVWRIPPMAGPRPNARPTEEIAASDAVALFVDRARAAHPPFQLDEAAALAVAEICRRLGGMPLAIELAAARLRTMSLPEIVDGLDDCLGLLRGGPRTAEPRQRTLEALIDWSWKLLDGAEQRLLRRLAVFAGGFRVEAAVAVASGEGIGELDVPELVAALVDKSLVTRDAHRYRMLDTIRAFAAVQLDESGERVRTMSRLLEWCCELAGGPRDRPLPAAWVDAVAEEVDNVRAALAWAFGPGASAERGIWLAAGLGSLFTRRRLFADARQWLGAAASAPGFDDSPALTRARVLDELSFSLLRRGDHAAARERAGAARAFYAEASRPVDAAWMLYYLGHVEFAVGDLDGAARRYGAAVTEAGALGVAELVSFGTNNLGLIAVETGHLAKARTLYEQAAETARGAGALRQLAPALANLGDLAAAEGDLEGAERLYVHALDAAQKSGATEFESEFLRVLGSVAARRGDALAARHAYEEAMRIGGGSERRAAAVMLAAHLVETGDLDEAREMATESHRDATNDPDPAAQSGALRVLAALGTLANDDEAAAPLLEAAVEIGRRPGLQAQVRLDSLIALGRNRVARGLTAEACGVLDEARAAAERIGQRDRAAAALEALAAAAVKEGRLEDAATALEAAAALATPYPPPDRLGDALRAEVEAALARASSSG